MLTSVALNTDLYQLTMAQGYWKLGVHTRTAVFELFFRENPFQGGYAIACGLEEVINLIESYVFTESDIEYLTSLKAQDGTVLFENDFLYALRTLKLTIDLDAIEEGRLVFPKEPLLRVQGPLWQCQLLETALLNIINFSTLIATKASRVCFAAAGDLIIEFGLRRAQGPNGGLMASRAAYVGGVASTSNVLAGKEFGIEVRGTHSHSWVMAFDSELEAFKAYAKALPNNCIFLVDTYKTLEGVQQAIEVGKQLKAAGHSFVGIRLDSGDMVALSVAARTLLDQAGFNDTRILASSDLDEYKIQDLKARGAKIDMWGVGTRLVTGHDQGALGGVYKLVSIQDEQGHWHHKAKESDDPLKQTHPGIHAVRRYSVIQNQRQNQNESRSKSQNKNENGHQNKKNEKESEHQEEKIEHYIKDVIYTLADSSAMNSRDLNNHVLNDHRIKVSTDNHDANHHDMNDCDAKGSVVKSDEKIEELLCPIFRKGKRVYSLPDLPYIQRKAKTELEKLPENVRSLQPTHRYTVEIFNEK